MLIRILWNLSVIYDKLLFAYFQESCFIFVNFFMFHQGSSVTLMHFLNVLGLRKIGFLQLAGLYPGSVVCSTPLLVPLCSELGPTTRPGGQMSRTRGGSVPYLTRSLEPVWHSPGLKAASLLEPGQSRFIQQRWPLVLTQILTTLPTQPHLTSWVRTLWIRTRLTLEGSSRTARESRVVCLRKLHVPSL